MKKIKPYKLIIIFMITIVSMSSVPVLASNSSTQDRDFDDFYLYAFHGNNYATYQKKETTNQYSYVKCTGLKNTTKVTFWTNNNVGRISDFVNTGISNYFGVMWYTPNNYTTKGKNVRLGMENYYNQSGLAYVSGTVDYE